MRREKKTKRTKAGLKGIQRRGGRIESLESRQMMFGDDVFATVDHHLPINPGIDFEPPVVIQPLDCIDFEDMPAAGVYGVGATFTADNTGLQAQFTGEPFTWSGGGVTAAGHTSVDHSNHAGHVGQDMMVNNILVDIDFGATVDGVVMNFGEFGGNLNLEINGDFRNFNNFQDVNGLNIGGVNVNVVGGGFGNDVGRLALSGSINSLKVGGQELWIDHVCAREKVKPRLDWGDAPDQPYPTLNANGGAHHLIDPDVFLGNRVEGEADGQPTFASDGDDVANIDDEDGVTFLTPLEPGNMATVEVVASTQGWLNAWIDFDRSGSWDVGTAEEIFSAEPLNAGVNILNFMVPAGIQPSANEPTYSRWRFSTTDPVLQPHHGPGAAIPNGEVEDHLAFITQPDPDPDPIYDFGDAPDQPYPTLMANGGAHHLINSDVFLGDRVEPELDGQPTVASDGDDVANIDDEDGVNFLTPIVPGGIAQVEVIASTDGYLNAWIDFDRNGSWDMGLPEQIFNAQPLVPGSNVLTFAVPATAQPAPNEPTYSRWRFSTTNPTLTPKADPAGAVPDGEVEDHLVFISEGDPDPDPRYDFGDAPDEPYPTLMANGGAHHVINQKVYLGDRVEPELDGQPTFASDGDDVANIDDEDGVNFLTPIVPGGIAQVEVIASTDGYLNAWIDFDRNGSWDMGLPEQIFNAQPLVPGSNVLTFAVPATAQPAPNEPTYSRWRFSTTNPTLTPKADPAGAVPDGEVEDHLVFISEGDPDPDPRYDFGDAPDQPYPTLMANGGAHHLINQKVYLGDRVEPELDGQPTFASDGDDVANIDDEDGVNFLTPIVPGGIAQVEVIASTDGYLNAWIDFDRNGSWDMGAPEQIFNAQPLVPGSNVLTFAVPNTAKPAPNEPTYSRWRFSTTNPTLTPKADPTGAVPDGEVEDHLVFISKPPQEKRLDFGDAPDQPYPTLLASDGARHYINPDVFLGARIDADPNGMPSFLATGDDLSDGNDDEDGVKFLTPIIPGHDVVAEVEASVDGFLDAWIDLNQNGNWEPSEQIALSTPMIPGTNHIHFVVPTSAIPTPTRPVYSRFRFSLDGGLSPHGPAKNGEVEDYATMTGDLDDDGTIGVIDIDHLATKVRLGDGQGDLNGDGVVNRLDMDHLVHNVLDTTYGDTNLDGTFDSEDIIQVFAAGHYEDGVDGNSGWAQGDWDGDGDFTTTDLIRALQDGGYNAGANATAGNGQVLAQPLLDSQPGDNQDVEESESDRSDRSQELSPVAQSPVVQSVDALFADDDRSLLGDGIADEEELMNTLAEDLTLV